MNDIYDDPAQADIVRERKAELARLQASVGDEPYSAAV